MDLGYFEAGLPVTDIARTLAFYKGFGFEHVDGAVDIRNVTVRRGDCRIGLYQGYLEPDRPQLIFWQGDVEATARDLEAKGASFHVALRKDDKGGAAFMLLDPDGNPLYFVSMPVFHVNDPGHERPAPPRTPTRAKAPDRALGWFELSLPVKDIERAVAFYRMLGFEPVRGSTEKRHVTLQNRDCRIGLYQGYLDPDTVQLIFWQGDVPASYRMLAAQGAAFEPRFRTGPVATDEGHVAAMLRDPAGQVIYLVNIPGVAMSGGLAE